MLFGLAVPTAGPSMHRRSWFSMAMHPAALYPAEAQQAINLLVNVIVAFNLAPEPLCDRNGGG